MPSARVRLGRRIQAAASEAALALLYGVRRLSVPAPDVAVVASQPPESAMSAFVATMTVVRGDLYEKLMDQYPDSAGRGPVPAGWERVDAEPAGVAPFCAYLRPPRHGAPLMLVLHGMYDSKRCGYVRVIGDALAGAGFGVALPDLRWHGELFSSQWPPTLGLAEADDLLAWCALLHERFPDSPIVLLGFSLGALYAINALARDGRRRIAGAIAVSPPAALHDTVKRLDARPSLIRQWPEYFVLSFFHDALAARMKSLGLHIDQRRPFSQLIERLEQTAGKPLLDAVEPSALAGRVDRPLLIIAARNDPVFPPSAFASLAQAAKSNRMVRVIQTPTGGHIGHAAAYPQWFIDSCAQFALAAAASA